MVLMVEMKPVGVLPSQRLWGSVKQPQRMARSALEWTKCSCMLTRGEPDSGGHLPPLVCTTGYAAKLLSVARQQVQHEWRRQAVVAFQEKRADRRCSKGSHFKALQSSRRSRQGSLQRNHA